MLLRTPVVYNASDLLGLNQPDITVSFNQKAHFPDSHNFLSNFAFHLPLTGATVF
jgi:hypothetical protein